MGRDVSIYMCFGVILDESIELPWEKENEDIDDWLTKELGIEFDGDWKDWRKIKDSFPIDVGYIGVEPYYDRVLFVPKSEKHAFYEPIYLDEVDMNIEEENVKRLIDFCEKYNIDIGNGPRWIVY